jgi:hypothetical protein
MSTLGKHLIHRYQHQPKPKEPVVKMYWNALESAQYFARKLISLGNPIPLEIERAVDILVNEYKLYDVPSSSPYASFTQLIVTIWSNIEFRRITLMNVWMNMKMLHIS